MGYVKEQFLEMMYDEEEAQFMEDFEMNMELMANDMEPVEDVEIPVRFDMFIEDVYAQVMIEEFVRENGRVPNYKEMSQGW